MEASSADLIECLRARDQDENVLDMVVSDYEVLFDQYRAERSTALQLRHDLDALRKRPSLVVDFGSHTAEAFSEHNREWKNSVERTVVRLQEELSKLYSVIGERDRALTVSHKQQQEDEEHIERLNATNAALENKLASAQDEISKLNEVNLQLRELKSENSFQERCRILEQENELILSRMKELSDQQSEAMNEMNEIVHRTKSSLAVTDEDSGDDSEHICTILDPNAWAKMFKDEISH